MSINGKRENITEMDLIKIADDNMIKKSEEIIEEVISVVSTWRQKAKEHGIDKKRIEKIGSNIKLTLT